MQQFDSADQDDGAPADVRRQFFTGFPIK
jgi:hypothetical protein